MGLAAIIQIIAVTVIGVAHRRGGDAAAVARLPADHPDRLRPRAVWTAVVSLLLIGPIGGLVSVRYSVKVEPLTALGLAS